MIVAALTLNQKLIFNFCHIEPLLPRSWAEKFVQEFLDILDKACE
jgi:hypothetical protein